MTVSPSMFEDRCEKCGLRSWDDLFAVDGLAGHEILVCTPCRREMEFDRDFVPTCDTEGS